MASHYRGSLLGKGIKPAIVASRYNEPIVEGLVQGAVDGFVNHGVKDKEIDIFWVPGAFEIPLIAKTVASTKKYHCIVCVGCVLKGETHHFEHVASNASTGIADAGMQTGIPVIFSILLADDAQKAWERAGGGKVNRGTEGALAALEMANLKRMLKRGKR